MARRPPVPRRSRSGVKPVRRYRSGFEARIAGQLEQAGVPFPHEVGKLCYRIERSYLPDFRMHSGIILESKGRFTAQDRAKMLAVRAHNPGADIRFVFLEAHRAIRKGSKTT